MPDWSVFRRLRGSMRTRAFESEMATEFELHLAFETDALVAAGMTPDAARTEARRRFGSVAQTADACRDSRGIRTIDALAQDVRFALRTFARCRSYTALVVLTLAVGIGATTAVFSVVHAVLLRSLPYANGDGLVDIRQQAIPAGVENLDLSVRELDEYRREAQSLDAIVEYHQMGFNLVNATNRSVISHVVAGVVSATFFDLLGVKPLLGRSFRPSDDAKDAEPVLILSYPYWRAMFAADPTVVGHKVEMNDRVHVIVGVLPPIPQYPDENDVYMPVAACPFRTAPGMETDRTMRMVSAIGRMKPGVTVERTRRELAAIAKRMAATFPDAYRTAGFTTTALPLHEQLTSRARPTLMLLFASTGCVLLLVCANVANLTLARLKGRARELALRAALGADRGRIVRQLLTESVALAVVAGGLGVALAVYARDLLVAFTARFTPLAAGTAIDRTVLGFALGASVGSGLLFGGIPAMRYAASHRSPGPTLRSRQLLIAGQVTIAFVLLVAAGLLVRSFINLQHADGGFRADHVLTARVDLDWVKYGTEEARRRFYRPLLSKLQAEPGVVSAALSLTFPLNQSSPFNASLVIDGPGNSKEQAHADFRFASPDYFNTIGMRVLRGGAFNLRDAEEAPIVMMNLSMARHHFGTLNVIGRRVSLDGGVTWRTIVGLVNDVNQYALADPAVDEVYLPFDQQSPSSARILVRSTGDPKGMLQAVERVAREVDPLQPISGVQTLDDVRRHALASPRITALLVTLLAGLALLITASGIAGVVAYTVSERSVEIGIRMALGAGSAAVIRTVVRDALQPVFAGAGCGLVAACVFGRSASRLLYGVGATDLFTYTVVAVMVAAVAALACIAPARRAARIDPMRALRAD